MKFVLIAIVVVVLLGVGIGVRAMHAGDKAPAGQSSRIQGQVGRALFLPEGFHERLHG